MCPTRELFVKAEQRGADQTDTSIDSSNVLIVRTSFLARRSLTQSGGFSSVALLSLSCTQSGGEEDSGSLVAQAPTTTTLRISSCLRVAHMCASGASRWAI